ncbi:hypothetical protein EI94DRAFT_1710357 [Lactarius quietus]|nr:hypothetical protein EI94DRAFT_1710357 [Lactarius quietus]
MAHNDALMVLSEYPSFIPSIVALLANLSTTLRGKDPDPMASLPDGHQDHDGIGHQVIIAPGRLSFAEPPDDVFALDQQEHVVIVPGGGGWEERGAEWKRFVGLWCLRAMTTGLWTTTSYFSSSPDDAPAIWAVAGDIGGMKEREGVAGKGWWWPRVKHEPVLVGDQEFEYALAELVLGWQELVVWGTSALSVRSWRNLRGGGHREGD